MHVHFVRFLTASAALLLSFAAVVADAGAIPAEYQQLKYVKSSQGQIIRTGVVPDGAVPVVEIKYSMDESSEGKYVFGYWSSKQNIGTAIGRNSGKHWLRVGGTSGGGYGTMDNNVHTVRLNASDGTWVDDKPAHQTLAKVVDAGLTEYCLLGRVLEYNGNETLEPVKCTLYYATIWLNGEKVRNYIPCRRLIDGKVGLYETVKGEFCTGEVAGAQMEGGPDEDQPTVLGNYQISDVNGSKWQGESEGPHPVVSNSEGTVLTEGTDYELKWSLTTGSKACLLVCGKGTYEGTDEAFTYEATFDENNRWTFFKKVKYVESIDGSGPFFRTGVVPNGRVPVVRLKYRMKALTEDTYAFGYWNGSETAGTAIGWHNKQFWLRAWQTPGNGTGQADMKDHVVELNTAEGTKLDGKVVHPELKDVRDDSRSEYCLMGRSYFNSQELTYQPCDCRIYEATIWLDGEKVREFVPVITADESEYGLFDEVEGRFYRNAGSGLVGFPKIVPLKYVESTGNAVIPTEIHPKPERKTPTFELDFQFTAIPANAGWAFGYWSDDGNCGTAFGIYTSNGQKLFRQRVGTVAEDLTQSVDLNRHKVVINAAYGSKFDNTVNGDSLLKGVEESGNAAALESYCYYLFGRSGKNDGVFAGRIYGLKVWLNGELAADYRPAMRVVGRVTHLGVYDEVSKKFYLPQGELIAGPPKPRGLVISFW